MIWKVFWQILDVNHYLIFSFILVYIHIWHHKKKSILLLNESLIIWVISIAGAKSDQSSLLRFFIFLTKLRLEQTLRLWLEKCCLFVFRRLSKLKKLERVFIIRASFNWSKYRWRQNKILVFVSSKEKSSS